MFIGCWARKICTTINFCGSKINAIYQYCGKFFIIQCSLCCCFLTNVLRSIKYFMFPGDRFHIHNMLVSSPRRSGHRWRRCGTYKWGHFAKRGPFFLPYCGMEGIGLNFRCILTTYKGGTQGYGSFLQSFIPVVHGGARHSFPFPRRLVMVWIGTFSFSKRSRTSFFTMCYTDIQFGQYYTIGENHI